MRVGYFLAGKLILLRLVKWMLCWRALQSCRGTHWERRGREGGRGKGGREGGNEEEFSLYIGTVFAYAVLCCTSGVRM